jgi:exonuclease VII large subunit
MRPSFILPVLVLLGGLPAYGHHSFAAFYFEDQTISVEGELIEFDYRAPHALVYFTAPDAQGQMRKYSAEWSNPNRLGRDGITKETLKPGDRVVVTGSPGRNAGEYKVHLKGIERPSDGWSWRQGRR